MDTGELSTALTLVLALGSAGIATWFSRVLTKRLEASGHSLGKPWRWWLHVLAFAALVNVLMLFHYFPAGPFLPALLGAPIALAFARTHWPSEIRKVAYLAVGALSTAWLVLGAYELILGSWKETVVGAPIRVDLVYLLGPLLYYSSLKVYRAYSLALKSGTTS